MVSGIFFVSSFLEGIVLVFAGLVASYAFFRLIRVGMVAPAFLMIGGAVTFFVQGILYVLWALGGVKLTSGDPLFVFSVFSVITALILLFLVYSLVRKGKLLFLLLIFALSIIPLRIDMMLFFKIASVMSYLLVLIFFVELLVFNSKDASFRRAAISGIAYSGASLLFIFSDFFLNYSSGIVFFARNAALIMSLFFLGKCFERSKITLSDPKDIFIPALFVKYLIFVLGLSAFTLLGTLSIHELGHSFAARAYGCDSKIVLYEMDQNPYTEFSCASGYSEIAITASGIVLPFVIALFFIISGEMLIVRVGYLIMGFNLFLSFRDFSELSLSPSAIWIITAFSVVTVLFSIIMLSLQYLHEQAGKFFAGGEK
ncbi:hypothetical protein HYU11_04630 [Candidatus Woesearchaeota archaeon]|nr:hypothetical protein [Candidatus Woesearchaeota archaeon]